MKVQEFYQKYEDIRSKLIEFIKLKVPLSANAKRYLEEIESCYSDLKEINKPLEAQKKGIMTETFGLVTIESIEKFVQNYLPLPNKC